MGVLNNSMWNVASASSNFYEYQIENCLRLNGTDQALEKTFSGAASNDDAAAVSFWIKRAGADGTNSEFGSTTNTKLWSASTGNGAVDTQMEINTNNPTGYSDQLLYNVPDGGSNFLKAKWRDPSAWIHIVWIYNSDESTAIDRVKVYINGDQKVINDSNVWDNDGNNGYPNSGTDTTVGKNSCEMHIGRYVYDDGGWWGGLMADFICIDGTAAITDFGETKNGVWIPKDPSGLTFGNNGFWLKFSNSSAMGEDYSGNDNDFAHIGTIATHDQLQDTPTNNFCSINTVYRGEQTTDAKYGVTSEGNLTIKYSGSTDSQRPCTHKTPASGKWYFEYRIDGGGGTGDYAPGAGILDPNTYTMNGGNYNDTGSIVYTNNENKVRKNGSIVGTYGGSRGSNGDVMGIAVDLDNGAFYVSKNGTYQAIDGGSTGDPTSGASKTGAGATWTPASEFTSGMIPLSSPNGGSQPIITMNFGQNGTFNGGETAGGNSDKNGNGNFFTAPPTDYLAICSENLSLAEAIDPAETDDNFPQKLFNAVLYTGNDGGTSNNVTFGYKPDWVSMNMRGNTGGGYGAQFWDTTRGDDYYIYPGGTALSVTSGTDYLEFTSTGVKLDNNWDGLNHNGESYVAHGWRANGGVTSTNTNGSVNSTVQVDPSGHFSIVQWTGTSDSWSNAITVGHGLSSAPSVMWCKKIAGNTDQWEIFHDSVGNGGGSSAAHNSLRLDGTAALYTNQSYKTFGGTMPTATVFTVDGNNLNGSGDTVLAYCFANLEGYIDAGSYEGNGNADGTFVYTGFSPAFVVCKSIDSTSDWFVFDNERVGYNVDNNSFAWNSTSQESTTDMIDIVSNGFKFRIATDPNVAETYVYFAMAHNPFKYATAER